MDSTVVRAACPHDCPDTCAIRVTVHEGRAVKVQGDPDHPPTHGALCTKVSRYPERSYHPERVLQPLRRIGPKGSGRFEPVSWTTALGDIAARLKAIAERDPQAIVPYSYAGTMGLLQGESMAARFFHRLGASLLDRTICASAGGDALTATYGGKLGMHLAHYADSKLILIWGSNSIASNLHFWTFAQAAKRQGAKLVCIDPRKTETADKCHQHIALLPGTDGALALGLMRELVVNDWLDHDYIARHTEGWPALRERAMDWTPERTAQVCGITADEVRGLARDYGTTKPAAIRLNYGMQRVHGGGNAVRLVAILPCLVGAWRDAAGGLLLSASGWFKRFRNDAALQRPDLLAGRAARTINMAPSATTCCARARPPSARRSRRWWSTTATRWRWRPSRPRWCAVSCARRPVHRGARAFHDRHRRPCRLRAARHHAARAPRRAHQLRPHLRDDQRAGGGAAGPGPKPNTQIFRELAARMGFDEPCFATTTRPWRAGLQRRSRLRHAAPRRLGEAAAARGAVRRRVASTRRTAGARRRARPGRARPRAQPRVRRRARPSWRSATRWR
jgi:anaerobic selenocysteine-containing dehydrogenase